MTRFRTVSLREMAEDLWNAWTPRRGAATISGQVDFGTGLFSGPILDQTSGNVYVFSSNDGTVADCAGNPCSAVFQFSTTFVANDPRIGKSGRRQQWNTSSFVRGRIRQRLFQFARCNGKSVRVREHRVKSGSISSSDCWRRHGCRGHGDTA